MEAAEFIAGSKMSRPRIVAVVGAIALAVLLKARHFANAVCAAPRARKQFPSTEATSGLVLSASGIVAAPLQRPLIDIPVLALEVRCGGCGKGMR
jgi:hypothetical protein